MTCPEARKLLYDVETSRSSDPVDERKSLLMLAKAHLHVCVACNEYFEREREWVRALGDRLSYTPEPVPAGLLVKILSNVHQTRVNEVPHASGRSSGMLARVRRWFRR